MSLQKFSILLFFLLVFSSCQRENVTVGNIKKAELGKPVYNSQAALSAVPGVDYVAAVMPKPAGAIDGAALFSANCMACHQATGQGVPGAFPPLDGSPYVKSDKVERVASIMLYGLMGPISVNGTTYNNIMQPFGAMLKDQELAAIASYIRSSWSNKSGPITPEVFAAMRKKWGSRGQFNISELGEEK